MFSDRTDIVIELLSVRRATMASIRRQRRRWRRRRRLAAMRKHLGINLVFQEHHSARISMRTYCVDIVQHEYTISYTERSTDANPSKLRKYVRAFGWMLRPEWLLCMGQHQTIRSDTFAQSLNNCKLTTYSITYFNIILLGKYTHNKLHIYGEKPVYFGHPICEV